MARSLFVLGYPGPLGGANTELWHTVALWRSAGWEVTLIPTWGRDAAWEAKLAALGAKTVHVGRPQELARVPGLAGSPVIGFCNSEFLKAAPTLRKLGCPLVWVNCMTFLFDEEKRFYAEHGPMEAYVFQSHYQAEQLAPELAAWGYEPSRGHLIRGAFDLAGWEFRPTPHAAGLPYWLGRVSRPDLDKWSSNTWGIYQRVQVASKRAIMLGMNAATHEKLGPPPWWAECLPPAAIDVREFYARIHCLLPINGGARENWPRVGLEAMAAGVPIVAQAEWGWTEMIEHGVTGFLGATDEELAHWAAVLAYDEPRRLAIAEAARRRLETDLARPEHLLAAWEQLFTNLKKVPDGRPAQKTKRRRRSASAAR